MNRSSNLDDRVGHLEIVVGSVNTTLANVQSDVVRLTTAIDTLVNSKQTNWGVIASIVGVVLLVIAGYWTLAKQPYDLTNKALGKQIERLTTQSIENRIESARLEERLKWKK